MNDEEIEGQKDKSSLKEAFVPTNKSEFTVYSGRLFIGDPYRLGLPQEVEEQILRLNAGSDTIVSLPSGILVYTGSDMSCNVYVEGGRVSIVEADADPRKGNGCLFTTGIDTATLLIVDAAVYETSPIIFQELTPDPDRSEAFVQHYNTNVTLFLRKHAERIRKEEVVNVPKGTYRFIGGGHKREPGHGLVKTIVLMEPKEE